MLPPEALHHIMFPLFSVHCPEFRKITHLDFAVITLVVFGPTLFQPWVLSYSSHLLISNLL